MRRHSYLAYLGRRTFRWIELLILSLCISQLNCIKDDVVSDLPPLRLWTTFGGPFTSDSPEYVPYAWYGFNGPNPYGVQVKLRLVDENNDFLKALCQGTFNIQTSGSSTMLWDGRIWAVGLAAGRRLPIVPGIYRARLWTPENYNTQTVSMQIVANNWDTDSDGISDYVENENDGTITTPPFDPQTWISYNSNAQFTTYDAISLAIPTLIPETDVSHPNRGTHDYSIAGGNVGGNAGPGSLENGLRIANFGYGYYDKNWDDTYPNPYVHDEHNSGTLELINILEKVARQWRESHPQGPRMGIGDLSLTVGGNTSDHRTHENGRDVDIRYTRVDNAGVPDERPLNVQYYSSEMHHTRQIEMFQYFLDDPRVQIIYIDPNTGITYNNFPNGRDPSGVLRIAWDWDTKENSTERVHSDHFHVLIYDPDGTQPAL